MIKTGASSAGELRKLKLRIETWKRDKNLIYKKQKQQF